MLMKDTHDMEIGFIELENKGKLWNEQEENQDKNMVKFRKENSDLEKQIEQITSVQKEMSDLKIYNKALADKKESLERKLKKLDIVFEPISKQSQLFGKEDHIIRSKFY